MYKIIIQQEIQPNPDEPQTYMQTIHDVTTSSKVIVAATLRAIAEEFAPDPTILRRERSGLPTVYKGE